MNVIMQKIVISSFKAVQTKKNIHIPVSSGCISSIRNSQLINPGSFLIAYCKSSQTFIVYFVACPADCFLSKHSCLRSLILLTFQALIAIMNRVALTTVIEQNKESIPKVEFALRNEKLANADIKNSTRSMSQAVKKNFVLKFMFSFNIKRMNRQLILSFSS